jgi:hypothetical protein
MDLVIHNPHLILFLFLLDVAIVVFILYQIKALSDCKCFNNQDKSIDNLLNYLFYVECAILIIYIINFMQIWRLSDLAYSQIVLLRETRIVLIFIFVVLTILCFVLYYLLELLKEKVDQTCDCFQAELIYIFIFQVFCYSLSYLVLLHQLFLQWWAHYRKTHGKTSVGKAD